jgi:predicted acyl esterase
MMQLSSVAETWVKGVDTGIKTNTPMHLYEVGSERWINLERYPGVTNYIAWRLDEKNMLKSDEIMKSSSSTLVYGDPAKPESRLSYTSPPLAEGATLAGPMSVTIYASSSNTNLVLIAHLYDVAPDGSEKLITDGAVLGSQRELDRVKSWTDGLDTMIWPWPKLEHDNYLKPGKVYRFDMSLSPRQWSINPNHHLRLELTTQSPADVCPSNGVPSRLGTDPCGLTGPQSKTVPGGTYTIMHGPNWPSALNLPQLPFKFFSTVQSGTIPTASNEGNRSFTNQAFELPLDWGNDRKK